MAGICEGRVVIVTGAGRGIGRGHALEFARQGAKVVVNDLGAESDGTGSSTGPAGEVVDAIRAMGGEAIVNGADISDFEAAGALVQTAVDTFGGLDVLVCNAGLVRDRMLVSMTEAEFDAVVRVHLKGTFAPMHHAAHYWRERVKAGETNDARIITTSSAAGLFGNVGQSNYAAAKAGVAQLTRVASVELARYGVTANSIAPIARTRMTEQIFAEQMAVPEEGFDAMSADNVAPLVVWLGSPESRDVTGQYFEVDGGKLCVVTGFQRGPAIDRGDRWEPAEVGPALRDLLAKATPNHPVIGSQG